MKLPAPKKGSAETKRKAAQDTRKGSKKRGAGRNPSPTRSRAVRGALKREGRSAASHEALARQAHRAATKRPAADRSRSAKKAARTKGPAERSRAAQKAARTRARSS